MGKLIILRMHTRGTPPKASAADLTAHTNTELLSIRCRAYGIRICVNRTWLHDEFLLPTQLPILHRFLLHPTEVWFHILWANKKKQTNYYYSGHLQTIYTNTSTKKRAVKSGTNVCGERFSEFASHFSDNSNFISSTYFSIISTFSTQLLFTRGRIAFCKLKNKYKAKIKRFHQ